MQTAPTEHAQSEIIHQIGCSTLYVYGIILKWPKVN